LVIFRSPIRIPGSAWPDRVACLYGCQYILLSRIVKRFFAMFHPPVDVRSGGSHGSLEEVESTDAAGGRSGGCWTASEWTFTGRSGCLPTRWGQGWGMDSCALDAGARHRTPLALAQFSHI